MRHAYQRYSSLRRSFSLPRNLLLQPSVHFTSRLPFSRIPTRLLCSVSLLSPPPLPAQAGGQSNEIIWAVVTIFQSAWRPSAVDAIFSVHSRLHGSCGCTATNRDARIVLFAKLFASLKFRTTFAQQTIRLLFREYCRRHIAHPVGCIITILFSPPSNFLDGHMSTM